MKQTRYEGTNVLCGPHSDKYPGTGKRLSQWFPRLEWEEWSMHQAGFLLGWQTWSVSEWMALTAHTTEEAPDHHCLIFTDAQAAAVRWDIGSEHLDGAQSKMSQVNPTVTLNKSCWQERSHIPARNSVVVQAQHTPQWAAVMHESSKDAQMSVHNTFSKPQMHFHTTSQPHGSGDRVMQKAQTSWVSIPDLMILWFCGLSGLHRVLKLTELT